MPCVPAVPCHMTAVRIPVVILVVLAVSCAAVGTAAERSPNVIFFLVDDMGWQETSVPFHVEPTPLNARYRTPAMERLARRGMKFTQAYASAVCSPTRVSYLTGMNAARHGVTNWTLRRDRSPDSGHKFLKPPRWNVNGLAPAPGVERTVVATPLPALLRTAGYRTIHCGKAHYGAQGTPGEDPRALGFDVNIAGHAAGGPGSYLGRHNFSATRRKEGSIWDVPGLEAYHGQDIRLDEALTREAVKAIEATVAERRPFYLSMTHYAVHAPWEADDRFLARYTEAGLKGQAAVLASMIESMDKSLGDLLDACERLGVADDTVVIFMSDNGSPSQCPRNLPLRGHKITCYEGGSRVPMIVAWPGVTAPGSTCTAPVIVDDVFPTVLDIAAVTERDTVQTVDGVSLAPLLRGEPPAGDRELVWHFPHSYSGQRPFSSIRVGPWKLIYHHAECTPELFDLVADIGESRDLAADRPDVVADLAGRLARRLEERHAFMPIDTRTGRPVDVSAIELSEPAGIDVP